MYKIREDAFIEINIFAITQITFTNSSNNDLQNCPSYFEKTFVIFQNKSYF